MSIARALQIIGVRVPMPWFPVNRKKSESVISDELTCRTFLGPDGAGNRT